jgi:hypothetical protein
MLILTLSSCSFLLNDPADPLIGTDVSAGKVQIMQPEIDPATGLPPPPDPEVQVAVGQLTDPELIRIAVTETTLAQDFFGGDQDAAIAWALQPGRVTAEAGQDGVIEVQVHNAKEDPLRLLCNGVENRWLAERWDGGNKVRYHLKRPCTRWTEPVPGATPVEETPASAPAGEIPPTEAPAGEAPAAEAPAGGTPPG